MRKIKEYDETKVLERFIKEFFDFNELVKIGFFTKEMRGKYEAQAQKICHFFGMETVYEWRSEASQVHFSYAEGKRPEDEPFVTVIPSIYE